MGKRIYFTDEELENVIAACEDFAFLGEISRKEANVTWQEQLEKDRKLCCRIMSKLTGTDWQEGTDHMEQPSDWPTGSSVDFSIMQREAAL
ncbi:MAG: hypothetical protein ACXAEN_21855 [Candidatus Thorarchaeota archaeon]|jgi:hypothetical protein